MLFNSSCGMKTKLASNTKIQHESIAFLVTLCKFAASFSLNPCSIRCHIVLLVLPVTPFVALHRAFEFFAACFSAATNNSRLLIAALNMASGDASFPAGTALLVLYDFVGEESGELSVRAGETVQACAQSAAEAAESLADGWILVARSGRDKPGFVPIGQSLAMIAHMMLGFVQQGAFHSTYVELMAVRRLAPSWVDETSLLHNVGCGCFADYVSPMPSGGSSSPTPHSPASTVYPSHSASQWGSPAGPLPLASTTPAYPGAITPYASLGGATSPQSNSIPLALPSDYAHLFASHEEWFKAATSKRQDTYRNLQAEAMDLLRALAEAESRSSSLVSRLADLDTLIGEERSKWAGKSTSTTA